MDEAPPAGIADLIEGSDLDGLVRRIDAFSRERNWQGIHTLIDRCNEAVERGKQVWAAVHYAEYRLALDAPAAEAAAVVTPGAGRFAAGPLWEVAASSHSWQELGPYLVEPQVRSLVAQERALRGDDVPPDAAGRGAEVPLTLQAWEPVYPLATYRDDGVDVSTPQVPDLSWCDLGAAGEVVADPDTCDALLDVVRPWLDESSGRGEAVAVEGPAEAAIRALGPHRVRLAEVDLQTALAIIGFAGASGGAFGRRRGTPAGRTAAWWVLAVVLGMDEGWPVDPGELGREAAGLRWLAWDPGDQVGGWAFHLAVEDPDVEMAWAVSAVDAR
jgi:hypothetical protein